MDDTQPPWWLEMPLKLTLTKGEKFIVNGAVIRNDGRDASLVFENHAQILRNKDILTTETAGTPAARVYLALQCAYMFAERRQQHLEDFNRLANDYVEAAPSAGPTIEAMHAEIAAERLYGALKSCRRLIEHESEIFANVE